MRWTPAEVAGFAAGAGFVDANLVDAVAVALATSDGDDSWRWQPPGSVLVDQRGLWGVDVATHPEAVAGRDLFDPRANAAVAHELWSDAGGWAWAPAYNAAGYGAFVGAARGVVGVALSSPAPRLPGPDASTAGAGRALVSSAQQAIETVVGVTRALDSIG